MSGNKNGSKAKTFSKTVIILSLVSFFNDTASEILYPIMPLYLSSIGFTALYIGILEGIAEAVAGISKGYFGKLSDLKGKRLPFVTAGYALSSISKPLFALFANQVWVLSVRTLERLGKGLRTAPRDALLSENSAPENRGKVFGLHRAMDTLGAVIGPLLALLYLHYYPEDYKTMFLLAFFPSAVAVLLTLFVRDKGRKADTGKYSLRHYFSFFNYWKEAGKHYRLLAAGLFAFALINSSDMFLLLMVKNLGYSDSEVIKAYVFFNLIYALTSLPAGALADKIGFRKSMLAGFLIFAAAYAMIAVASGKAMVYGAFVLYGIFPSLTEGVSKAWISNITVKEKLGTAIGFFTGVGSIFTLLSSIIAGYIWSIWGPEVMFAFASAGAVVVFLYFLTVPGLRNYSSK